jgi:thioredoxin reductase (NADPH)
MEQMAGQALHCGAELIADLVSEVDLHRRPFTAVTDGGLRFAAETLVIATGATARWLGLPSEQHFQGAGVSACATCDGFFFRGKPVAVVGGGNTAAEEALYLSQMCSRVTLIHRRDELRADKTMQARLFRNPKVEILWDSVVEEVLGADSPKAVTGLRVRNLKTGDIRDVEVEGLFVAIGHDPATELFRGQIEMDGEGYIVTAPDSTVTNVPGVFAAGDVQDKLFRQAVTAAGTGCMAALEAEKWLAEEEDRQAEPVAASAVG